MTTAIRQFAEAVRQQLLMKQISAPELAKAAGISAKTVNNILNGRHSPQLDQLVAIASALDMDLWQFWFPDLPAEIGHDDTFPVIVSELAQLSPEARKSIARLIRLELKDHK